MAPYIITFLAVALFPLALAAYGGHLATLALEEKPRKKALFIVWSLALAGVVATGLQQVGAYRSDKQHDAVQDGLTTKLDQSLQRQQDGSLREQYMRGQLDSITVMVGKLAAKDSGGWPPAVVAALTALSKNAGSNAASKQAPVPPEQSSPTPPNPYMNMTPAALGAKADIVINQFARMSTGFSQNIANIDKQAPSSYPSKQAQMMDERARYQSKQDLYRSMVVSCRNSRSDTILLVQAMLAKTGVQPPPEPSCLAGGIVNFPSDLQAVSDYLRRIRNDL